MKTIPVLIACLFTSQCCSAQDLYITNARVIDGLGQTIENGSLVVVSGRIQSVGPDVQELADAIVIDAGGMTVMPGIINTHWHLFAGSAANSDEELDRYLENAVAGSLEAILGRGVTTVMSPGDHFPKILTVRDQLKSGALRGPRLVAVGPVFTSPGDWPTQICGSDDACNARLNAVVSTAEQARNKVRELAAADVDALKLVYDDVIAPDARLDDAVVAAIADEADQHDLPLFAHLSSKDVPAATLIKLGVDGFVHSEMDLTGALQAMRDQQIPVITTATATLSVDERAYVHDRDFVPSSEGYFNSSLENIRTLWDERIPVAFGTDSVAGPTGLSSGFLATTASGEGQFLAEARALSRVLTNEQIVTSMTRNAAFVVGLDDEIGTLETGKIADIIVIDGDPLADISDLEKVRMVIQGGIVVVDNR